MKALIRAGVLALAVAVPAMAQAATAIATTDVNLRAGPSTRYPVVDVVWGGEAVRVHGCLASRSWCDVSFRGLRGWMSANYIAYLDNGRRYTDRVIRRLDAPIISFSFGSYWDNHYRGYGFYRDRHRFYDDYRPDWRPEPRRPRGDWGDRRDRRREAIMNQQRPPLPAGAPRPPFP